MTGQDQNPPTDQPERVEEDAPIIESGDSTDWRTEEWDEPETVEDPAVAATRAAARRKRRRAFLGLVGAALLGFGGWKAWEWTRPPDPRLAELPPFAQSKAWWVAFQGRRDAWSAVWLSMAVTDIFNFNSVNMESRIAQFYGRLSREGWSNMAQHLSQMKLIADMRPPERHRILTIQMRSAPVLVERSGSGNDQTDTWQFQADLYKIDTRDWRKDEQGVVRALPVLTGGLGHGGDPLDMDLSLSLRSPGQDLPPDLQITGIKIRTDRGRRADYIGFNDRYPVMRDPLAGYRTHDRRPLIDWAMISATEALTRGSHNPVEQLARVRPLFTGDAMDQFEDSLARLGLDTDSLDAQSRVALVAPAGLPDYRNEQVEAGVLSYQVSVPLLMTIHDRYSVQSRRLEADMTVRRTLDPDADNGLVISRWSLSPAADDAGP